MTDPSKAIQEAAEELAREVDSLVSLYYDFATPSFGMRRSLVDMLLAALSRVASESRRETLEEAAKMAVPTNWVDPLLTGPQGIGFRPYSEATIERLLRGIAARVRSLGSQGGE